MDLLNLEVQAPHNPDLEEGPPPRPRSPWAERFGVYEDTGEDAVFSRNRTLQHSGYAPEPLSPVESSLLTFNTDPTVHPLWYGDAPSETDIQQSKIFANNADRDKFLFSENAFRRKWDLIRPWQPGPLNHALLFSERGAIPGGNESASAAPLANPSPGSSISVLDMLFESELITPDETTWLPFLRKVRWRDWYGTSPLTNGTHWSIDNPSVWRVMGVVLEVANRILLALLADDHPAMSTILNGYYGYWDECDAELTRNGDKQPNRQVLVSYECYDYYRQGATVKMTNHMERLRRSTVQQRRERLETLLGRLTWAWDHRLDGVRAMTSRMWNENDPNPALDVMIQMDIKLLREYIEGNISVAERCRIIMDLITCVGFLPLSESQRLPGDRLVTNSPICQLQVLHELAHAIIYKRSDERLQFNPIHNQEPYVDFSGGSEAGFWFENAIFGGTSVPVTGEKGPMVARHLEKWPAPHTVKQLRRNTRYIVGHSDYAAGKIIEEDFLPVSYDSMLLSEAFWQDATIPRKSDNYFNRIPLFVRRTPNDPTGWFADYVNEATVLQRQLTPIEETMVQRWNEGHSQWVMARAGWYDTVKDRWDNTWWGDWVLRYRLIEFSKAFKARDLVSCIAVSRGLVDNTGWHLGDPRIWAAMLHTGTIAHHLLGLLMLASIPIYHHPILGPDLIDDPGYIELSFYPSQEMTKWKERPANLPEYVKSPGYVSRNKQQPASRLFDLQTGQAVAPPWSQLAYLECVGYILNVHQSMAGPLQLPAPWVKEILRVANELRAYWLPKIRHVMTPQGVMSSLPKWAPTWAPSWTFEVPDYEPGRLIQWDTRGQRWIPAVIF
ncbi:hypothetical protein F5Y18DRAFT_436405 [Xylariaceae sp. FL1019]|nr:hypothetical protein F5Y18DRAFT_436405 [Xylariaceae sp. FL1019]